MEDLTLGQFQEILYLQKSDISEDEKMTEMVAILLRKSVKEVDEMPVLVFNQQAKIINEYLRMSLPDDSPKRIINGVGITYEPAKLNRGQYVTVNHFISKDIIDNAHNILAALSYNPKTGNHEPDKFSETAALLQDAPMRDVVSTCLFFCNLYAASMKALKNFLAAELIMKKVPKKKAIEAVEGLMTALDGYTTQSRSQTLRT